MVRSPSVKDFLREIKKTMSRFLSIVLLLILSVAFFSGLRATQPDMYLTADGYMDAYDMYDIRVMSNLGLTEDDLAALRSLDYVDSAAGLYRFDVVAASQDAGAASPDADSASVVQDIVITAMTTGEDGMNAPELLSGQLPREPGECAAEERFLSQMNLELGDTFDIIEVQSGFEDALTVRTLRITGLVRSPLYMTRMQRGSSTLGSGTVAAYIILPANAVTLDYYTEIDIAVTGAKDETAYTDPYHDAVTAAVDSLSALGETRAQARHDEVVSEAEDALGEAKTELSKKQAELDDAKKQLADAKSEYAAGQKELADQKAAADSALEDAEAELDEARRDIESGTRTLNNAQSQLDAQKKDGEAQLEAVLNDLNMQQAALSDAWASYANARAQLDAQLAQWNALPESDREAQPDTALMLEEAQAALDAQKEALDEQQAALTAGFAEFDIEAAALKQQLHEAQAVLDEQKASLFEAQRQLDAGRRDYEEQRAEADRQIAEAEAALADAGTQLADGEEKAVEGEAQLKAAQNDIDQAEQRITKIPEGKWYIEDRSANLGYSSYGDDADRMGAIGNVFPIIFFAVAALVALTTMTRMVDEKRREIGAYKALGHSFMTTAGKFIFYGLLATAAGVAGGLLLGTLLFPTLIFKAYDILYDLPPLQTPPHIGVSVISAAAALITTVGATSAATMSTLRETPANLLRPKAPEPGKRVFLEYITPLWRRLSFFAKVSLRNIFRYKKRLIMTLLGIAGCTALIVAGFGFRDSLRDVTEFQFGKIFKYDLLAYMTKDADEAAMAETLSSTSGVSDFMLDQSAVADFSAGGRTMEGHMIVPASPDRLGDFVRLAHRSDGTAIPLTDDGAVITEKLAELLNLRPGDTFTVNSGGSYTVTVSDVAENYVIHYIYMTPAYYEAVFSKAPQFNQAFLNLITDTDAAAESVSSALLKTDDVGYVSYFSNIARDFQDSMDGVNNVVLIILISAALLALVVLYNLTNINITERMRELATIKVLGFYDREVSFYIMRENTILTIAGVAAGLLGGYFLHQWLVMTVESDFVMFGRSAKPISFLYAALLTFLIAALVNLLGQRRMKHINMIESLKTNE